MILFDRIYYYWMWRSSDCECAFVCICKKCTTSRARERIAYKSKW